MDDPTANGPDHRVPIHHLRFAAAALTYVVAAIHLFHPKLGIGRLVLLLSVKPALLLSDPRPVLFVVSGLALVLAVPLAAYGAPERPLYGLGLGLMTTYLVGYFAWHFSGHGGFLPGRKPLYHGLAPLEAVVAHLSSDPIAAAAVTTELLLAVVLVVLLFRDR